MPIEYEETPLEATKIKTENKPMKTNTKTNNQKQIGVKNEDDEIYAIANDAMASEKKRGVGSLVKQAKTLGYTVWELGLVLVPAALSAYLIFKYKDVIVRGVGVVAGLYAAWHLVENAYCVASSKVK